MRILRRLSARLYVQRNIGRIKKEIHRLKAAGLADFRLTRTLEEQNAIVRLMNDLHEFEEWKQELDDKDLKKKARRIGVFLDEIEFPEIQDQQNYGRYYCIGTFGNELLRDEFRRPLIKAIREREPVYLKAKYDRVELYLKLATVITGIMGACIGLIAILKK